MIEIRHGRKEPLRTSLAITNNETTLASALNIVHLNHRPSSLKDIAHNILVDGACMLSCFDQKILICYLVEVSLLLWRRVGAIELALGNEIATELRSCHAIWHGSIGAIRLDSISIGCGRRIKVFFINPNQVYPKLYVISIAKYLTLTFSHIEALGAETHLAEKSECRRTSLQILFPN